MNQINNEKLYDYIELVIVRVRKDGSMAIAKPCSGCLPIIQRSNVTMIRYTDRAGIVVSELASEMTTDHLCSSHLAKLARNRLSDG